MRSTVLLLAALLSGCASSSDQRPGTAESSSSAATPAGAVSAPSAPPLPTPRPEVKPAQPQPAPESETESAADAETAAETAARPVFTLSMLDQASAETVRDLLGDPSSIAALGPSQTWTFRSVQCTLEVYMYPQIGSSVSTALGHQLFPEKLSGPRRAACLEALARKEVVS